MVFAGFDLDEAQGDAAASDGSVDGGSEYSDENGSESDGHSDSADVYSVNDGDSSGDDGSGSDAAAPAPMPQNKLVLSQAAKRPRAVGSVAHSEKPVLAEHLNSLLVCVAFYDKGQSAVKRRVPTSTQLARAREVLASLYCWYCRMSGGSSPAETGDTSFADFLACSSVHPSVVSALAQPAFSSAMELDRVGARVLTGGEDKAGLTSTFLKALRTKVAEANDRVVLEASKKRPRNDFSPPVQPPAAPEAPTQTGKHRVGFPRPTSLDEDELADAKAITMIADCIVQRGWTVGQSLQEVFKKTANSVRARKGQKAPSNEPIVSWYCASVKFEWYAVRRC